MKLLFDFQGKQWVKFVTVKFTNIDNSNLGDLEFENMLLKEVGDQDIKFISDKDSNRTIETKNNTQSEYLQKPKAYRNECCGNYLTSKSRYLLRNSFMQPSKNTEPIIK